MSKYLSIKSITFLRPIYRDLINGNLILFRVCYSRCGGDKQIFVIDRETALIPFIRKLPEQAVVQWWSINEPEWTQESAGLVPMKDGSLQTGAY